MQTFRFRPNLPGRSINKQSSAIDKLFEKMSIEVMIIDGKIVSFSNRRPTAYARFLGVYNQKVRVKLIGQTTKHLGSLEIRSFQRMALVLKILKFEISKTGNDSFEISI